MGLGARIPRPFHLEWRSPHPYVASLSLIFEDIGAKEVVIIIIVIIIIIIIVIIISCERHHKKQ